MRTRRCPTPVHTRVSSHRCTLRAATRAMAPSSNTASTPSPVFFSTAPSWSATMLAIARLCSDTASAIAAVWSDHSRVLRWMSVKRKTRPVMTRS